MIHVMQWVKRLGLSAAAAAGIAGAGLLTASCTTTSNAVAWQQRSLADARWRFLHAEKFARLPLAEQAQALPGFYRKVVPSALNSLAGMLSSHVVSDILNDQAMPVPGKHYGDYAEQLEAVVPTMSIEQVADRLAYPDLLNLAANARTAQALRAQEKALAPLITADLEAKDFATFNRGSRVVAELHLTQFTGKILEVYFGGDARAQEASRVLVWLRDPAIVPRLLEDVEKDPHTLARHEMPLHAVFTGKKADPVLLKLMSSPDSEVRYYAAETLSECDDPALHTPLAGLAKDPSPRTQILVLFGTRKWSDDEFRAIRRDMLGTLASKDPQVLSAALEAFSRRKDIAAAPAIRTQLAAPAHKPGDPTTPTQYRALESLRALTGTLFGYDQFNWDPEKNAAAIAKFDEWVLQHGGAVELPVKP